MAEKYPINIWINEERHAKQKDQLLKLYSMAKYDSATTKSIELLPAEVKDKMFDLVIERKKWDVIEEFLKKLR